MRKIFFAVINSFLSVSLVMGQAPASFAQEAVLASPSTAGVAPGVGVLARNINLLNKDILNHSRANRDQEIVIRQLIDENNLLTQALCERQRTVLQLRQQVYGIGAEPEVSNGCDSTSWLFRANRAMLSYRDEVVLRDKKSIERNSSSVLEKTATADEVAKLAQEVIAMKASLNGNSQVPSSSLEKDLSVQQALAKTARATQQAQPPGRSVETGPIVVISGQDAIRQAEERFQAKLSELQAKIQVMEAKRDDLGELRFRLTQVNAQLREADSKYEELARQYGQVKEDQRGVAWDLKEKVHQRDAVITEQQATIDRLNTTVNDQMERIAEVTRQWYGKDGLLMELKNKLTASDAKLQAIDAVLKDKDRQIMELKGQLAKAKDELVALKKELAETKGVLERSQKELRSRDNLVLLQKKAIAGLRLDLASLQVMSSGREQVIVDQGQALARFRNNVKTLQDLVMRQKQDINGRDETIVRLTSEFTNVKAQGESLGDSADEGSRILTQLKDQVHSLRDEFTERDQDMAQVEKVVGDLRGEIKALQGQLAKKDGEITALSDPRREADRVKVVNGLRAQAGDLQGQLAKRDEAIATLNAQLKEMADLAQKNQAQIKQINELTAKVRTMTDASAQKEEDLRLAREENSKQKGQIDLLNRKLRLSDEQQAVIEQKVAALEAKASGIVSAYRGEQQQQRQGLDDAQKDLAAKERELDALRKELADKTAESARFVAMLDVYQGQAKDAQDQYNGGLDEVMAAKKRQSALETEIARLTDEIALKDIQVNKTKEYFVELEKRYSVVKQEVQAKDISLSMMQNMADQNAKDHLAKTRELQRVVDEQKTQLDSLKRELALGGEKLSATQSFSTQLEARQKEVERLETQLQARAVQIQELARQIEQVKTDLQFKDKEILRLKDRSREKESEFKAVADEAVKTSQEEVAVLVAKLKALEKELGRMNKTDEMTRLKDQLAGSQDEIKQLNKALKDAQDPKGTRKLKDALTQAQDKVRASNDEIAQLRQAVAESKDKLKEVQPQLVDKDRQLKAFKSDFAAKAKEHQGSIDGLKQKVEEQKDQVVQLKKQLEERPASTVNDRQGDDAGLKARLKAMQAVLADLRGQLASKTDAMGRERARIDDLRGQLKTSQKEIVTLTARIEKYKSIDVGGLGNEGYLMRDGKHTALKMAQVSSKMESMQQELISERESRQDIENKYAVLMGELNEARVMLQSCWGKIMSKPEQPVKFQF